MLGRRSLAGALLLLTVAAHAEDLPVFRVLFKDGTIAPTRIQAPAGKRFKLEVVNAGKTPVEFESLPLRKEKVLGPGVTSFVVIKASQAGEYPFFDDFHQQARGVIVIK
ncbi:exported protein [Chitiniphilus shinanonensis]|uniref:Exported protein n=1 Tax=Chitiniphilus shinanonensis TaxID=553088 RepID=A0ABQ6BT64_9NEIS|nr:cupredoxin domain-containing protein [Chitiniphilus shinanonensis]GLS05200.1 exported protein [Chitiniphilus shinanonensis]